MKQEKFMSDDALVNLVRNSRKSKPRFSNKIAERSKELQIALKRKLGSVYDKKLDEAMTEATVIKHLKFIQGQFMVLSDALNDIDINLKTTKNVIDALGKKGLDVRELQSVVDISEAILKFGKNNKTLFDAENIVIDFIESNKGNLKI